MTTNVNVMAIRLAILGVAFSALVAYFGQPLVHDNKDAVNVIVTVFSVLAGFLVAIIALVGDPVLLPPGTWRAAEMERTKLTARLHRHRLLFNLYLVTLATVFLAMLVPDRYANLTIWLERAFLFFGVLAFTMSFFLPSALMQVQRERIDAIIEHRRKMDGIKK